jgi:hypothetical protein
MKIHRQRKGKTICKQRKHDGKYGIRRVEKGVLILCHIQYAMQSPTGEKHDAEANAYLGGS